jgi:peptide methionine sulfoxide reductase MsrB
MDESSRTPKTSRVAWREALPPERYVVLFEEATEPAGTSPLNREKRAGTYLCAACNQPLFRSEAKFESGTGWPSFTAPVAGAVDTRRDFRLFWPRTEYHCPDVRAGGGPSSAACGVTARGVVPPRIGTVGLDLPGRGW